MTYDQWRRDKEAELLKQRGFIDIPNKKPISASKFLDLATESAKYVESQEKVRKKAEEGLDTPYNRYIRALGEPLKPVSKVPNPNDAFKHRKKKKYNPLDYVEIMTREDEYLEYKGRPYKKMPGISKDVKVIDDGIHAKAVEETREDDVDYWEDDETNQM